MKSWWSEPEGDRWLAILKASAIATVTIRGRVTPTSGEPTVVKYTEVSKHWETRVDRKRWWYICYDDCTKKETGRTPTDFYDKENNKPYDVVVGDYTYHGEIVVIPGSGGQSIPAEEFKYDF
ncbi:hypothetical protein [uncultured Desulfuromusa sp.]|uniref:hypothetical protein n=1 Tax=uncultured Desulfuromusa sp. TaxID=219183 RepID=UPI002AA66677|nr:hypothetical protein [uncultured Desulfuromusa sp.]